MDNRKKENPYAKFIGLAVALLFMQPLLFFPLAVIGVIAYVVYKCVIQPAQTGTNIHPAQPRQASFGQRPKDSSINSRPKELFCFHKDKGEHHVARGKERDPWDRPDIDISKYQRK